MKNLHLILTILLNLYGVFLWINIYKLHIFNDVNPIIAIIACSLTVLIFFIKLIKNIKYSNSKLP